MMLIKGEYFNTGSNLFDHVKIQGDTLAGVLSRLYEESDCDFVEEFLDYIKDENILIYIEKEGVC
nr:MAG TPA: hypothetical protein [Caudoviricetes sp.]